MAKKKSCCNWSGTEWFGILISEAALFVFIWYVLMLLGATGMLWVSSLILLALLNVMFFTCPMFKKHFM